MGGGVLVGGQGGGVFFDEGQGGGDSFGEAGLVVVEVHGDGSFEVAVGIGDDDELLLFHGDYLLFTVIAFCLMVVYQESLGKWARISGRYSLVGLLFWVVLPVLGVLDLFPS